MRLMRMVMTAAAAACMCGCAAPAGKAAKEAKPAGGVLATIGDETITEKDLDEKIAAMPPRVRGRFQSPAGKKNLLNQMVELELIYREAEREGLDRDKDTIARLAELKKRLAAEKLREKVLEAVKVDKEDIRKEYEKSGDRYKTPKQVKVSQIVFTWDKAAPQAKIDSVKKDAADILARAKKGEDFAELAKKYSLDQASAAKGGDIGYATRRTLSPEAYKAAMAMEKAGEISGLIEGKDEVRIVKAAEVVPEKKKPFEEVSPWLEGAVRSRKQREAWLSYVAELKKKEGVVVHDEELGAAEKKEGAPEVAPGAGGAAAPGQAKQAPMQIMLDSKALQGQPAGEGRAPGAPIRIAPPAGRVAPEKAAPPAAPVSGDM